MMPALDFLGFLAMILVFALNGFWQVGSVKTSTTSLQPSGLFALVATLAIAEFNTSMLICISSAGFLAGDWAITLPLFFLISLSLYAITVANKFREQKSLRISDIFYKKFGANYARAASICLICAMIVFSSNYVRSLALFFLPLLRIDLSILSTILVASVVLLTLKGGLTSILRFDMVNFVLILFLLPLIFYWTINFTESIPVEATKIIEGRELLPPSFILSLIVLTSFTYIVAPGNGQKIFLAKNAKIARWSAALSAVLVFALYAILVLACSALQKKGIELKSAENALPFIIANVVPVGARGMAYGLIFCIGASSLAGVWNALTSMVMSELFIFPGKSLKKPLIVTLFFAFASLVLANTLIDQVFHKVLLATIPLFALSFSVLAAFYWPRIALSGAYASTFVGLLWGFFCYFYFEEQGNYTFFWAFLGLPLIFLSGIGCSLLNKTSLAKKIQS